MKIVMTLLVRDSEELLRDNLEFHLRQGVDFFVITDNASVDGTPGIVEEYVRAGLAELILEPEDTYSQARWVTRMARRAAEHGADWVINSDDDEFWSGRGGSLREALTEIPPRCDAVRAVRRNHPPLAVSAGPPRLETMVYRELQSFNALGNLLQPKVCHRAFADIEVAQGNHAVLKSGALFSGVKTGPSSSRSNSSSRPLSTRMSQSSQKTSSNGAARMTSGQIHRGQSRLPGLSRGGRLWVACFSSSMSGSSGRGEMVRPLTVAAWARWSSAPRRSRRSSGSTATSSC